MRTPLVKLREDAGITRQQLALALDVAERTIGRWESGERTPSMSVRGPLAGTLGCSLATLNAALRDDEEINGHSVNKLGLLVSLEQGATEIRWWEPVSMPALLQTERYALSVESAWPLSSSESEIARRVSLRMQRQKVLDRLRLFALIDRSVLTRATGGPSVMAGQVEHLRSLTERPNIDVRVVPLDQRAHAAGTGPFKILTGDGDYPHTVITHSLLGPQYWDGPLFLPPYENVFEHLWSESDDLAKIEL